MHQYRFDQAIIGTTQLEPLFLTALKNEMQQRSIHQVGVYHEWTQPLSFQVPRPIPERAVNYLRLILDGIHPQTLREWLTTVHEVGYQPQLHVVASLTLFLAGWGQGQTKYVPLIREVLGEDGMAMVPIILETAPITPQQRLIAHRLLNFQTATYDVDTATKPHGTMSLIHRLKGLNRTNIQSTMRYLQHTSRIWDMELTNIFLDDLLKGDLYGYLIEELHQFTYFFALELDPETLARSIQKRRSLFFRQKQYDKTTLQRQQRVAPMILRFRQEMVAAIKGEE